MLFDDEKMEEAGSKFMDAIKEEPIEQSAEPVEQVAEAVEKPAEEPRTRDDKGKFAKIGQNNQAQVIAPAVQEPVEQPTYRKAPSSWKPGAKAAWDALPDVVKDDVLRREGDWLKGQSELLPDAQVGKNIREIVAPYLPMIQAEGATPEKAIAALLQTAAVFRTGTPQQKQQAVIGLIKQYNVPVNGQQAQPVYQDPRVDQMMAAMQQREREAQQNAERQTNDAVESFINEADAQGKPLRPYLENVQSVMLGLIPNIKAENPALNHQQVLQAAYDSAVWANPEIRALLQQQQVSELEAKRRGDNLQRTNQAKRAASVNVPRRGITPQKATVGNMEETIRETARNLGFF